MAHERANHIPRFRIALGLLGHRRRGRAPSALRTTLQASALMRSRSALRQRCAPRGSPDNTAAQKAIPCLPRQPWQYHCPKGDTMPASTEDMNPGHPLFLADSTQPPAAGVPLESASLRCAPAIAARGTLGSGTRQAPHAGAAPPRGHRRQPPTPTAYETSSVRVALRRSRPPASPPPPPRAPAAVHGSALVATPRPPGGPATAAGTVGCVAPSRLDSPIDASRGTLPAGAAPHAHVHPPSSAASLNLS